MHGDTTGSLSVGWMLLPHTSPPTLGTQQMGGKGISESITHILCTLPFSHIIHFLFLDKNKYTQRFYFFFLTLSFKGITEGHIPFQIIVHILNTKPHIWGFVSSNKILLFVNMFQVFPSQDNPKLHVMLNYIFLNSFVQIGNRMPSGEQKQYYSWFM